MQDYLKAMYTLAERGERLTNSAVAEQLGISAPSVSLMMKRLAERGCVDYSPYQEVQLTAKGQQIALEMIRHHRIIETFLVRVLGMSWDEVHAEAEKLEHVISETLEARMAAVLGHPDYDPHGHPIPTLEGRVEPRVGLVDLAVLEAGITAVVRQVSDEDPAALRYLDEQGIRLGSALTVARVHPFDGPLELVGLGEQPVMLSRRLAAGVRVEPV